MAENFDAPKAAAALSRSLGNPKTLTRDQATLYSNAVRISWKANGLASWTKERSLEQLDDVVRLIESAKILTGDEHLDARRNLYRRAGELLDWLAKSKSVARQQKKESGAN